MAYSRFSKQSNWYCFWSSMGNEDTMYKLPTRRLKRKQVFQICDIPSYYVTYGEIMDKGIPAIIDDIRHYYYYSHGEYKAKRPTEKDMMQMYDYIKIFVDDIDRGSGRSPAKQLHSITPVSPAFGQDRPLGRWPVASGAQIPLGVGADWQLRRSDRA